MEKLVIYFTPAAGQLAGFAALLVVCVGLFLIGKLLRRQNTLPEINLIAGWSTASLIMIVGTGLLKIDLRIITAILAAAAVFAAVRMFRRRAPDGSSDLRTVDVSRPAAVVAHRRDDDFPVGRIHALDA